MFRGFRLVVSVTAALPINTQDGEAVYNIRGSVSTGHFLGQLFRTLGQVLNLQQPDNQQIEDVIHRQLPDSTTPPQSSTEEQFRVESRVSCNQEAAITKDDGDDLRSQVGGEVKPPFCHQESKQVKSKENKKDDKWSIPSQEKEDITSLKGEQPTCQNLSQGAPRITTQHDTANTTNITTTSYSNKLVITKNQQATFNERRKQDVSTQTTFFEGSRHNY